MSYLDQISTIEFLQGPHINDMSSTFFDLELLRDSLTGPLQGL